MVVDPGRLFDGEDPDYELWLGVVADRVESLRRRQANAAKGKKKGK